MAIVLRYYTAIVRSPTMTALALKVPETGAEVLAFKGAQWRSYSVHHSLPNRSQIP